MRGQHRKHRKPLRTRVAVGLRHLARTGSGSADRPEHHRHRPVPHATPDPPRTAPATITHPVVPDTVSDIDPARQPAELPTRTTAAARAAVNALHTEHPGIPASSVRWTYLDDGAHGVVTQDPAVSDEDRRGVVAVYAAALAARIDTRARDDGFVICSVAGQHPAFPGLRIAVEATCCPEVEERLAVFEAAVADLHPDEPDELDEPAHTPQPDTPAPAPIPAPPPALVPASRCLPAAPALLALPAPREAK